MSGIQLCNRTNTFQIHAHYMYFGHLPDECTLFENYSNCRIWILAFSTNFVLLKLNCLVILYDRKLQVFKNSPKWTFFGIFNKLLSTQNVNVARFARIVEWDFLSDFQTPWNEGPNFPELFMTQISEMRCFKAHVDCWAFFCCSTESQAR